MSAASTPPCTNETRSATPARAAVPRPVRARALHQARIELDAKPARPELPRRRDHDASVARSKIGDEVAWPGLRERKHAMHHLVGGGDERHGERFLRRAKRGRKDERENRQPAAHGMRRSIAFLTSGAFQSIAPR